MSVQHGWRRTKEIKPQFANDENSRNRFTIEAEITGALEHPGIVPVYGLGHYADGRPYYAMRFIRGHSLKAAIERFHQRFRDARDSLSGSHSGSTDDGASHPTVPGEAARRAEPDDDIGGERSVEFRRLLDRFIDVCQTLEYAHSRGVLHRDVKPSNIMLGKYGETLVVDWGLAKAAGHAEPAATVDEVADVPQSGSVVEPTQAGSVIGTAAYMSPEQAAGRFQELGPTTDIYSLGATLFYLLTGQSPFPKRPLHEMLAQARLLQFR